MKVITLKTQLHAVNSRWKRLSQRSFSFASLHNFSIICTKLGRYMKDAIVFLRFEVSSLKNGAFYINSDETVSII